MPAGGEIADMEPRPAQRYAYERVRPYLRAVMSEVIAGGGDLRAFVEFALSRLGDAGIPRVARFVVEAREGRVRVQGLTRSLRVEFFMSLATPEAREELIREEAYLQAAARAFNGEHAQDDWLLAEREVDRRLGAAIGLVPRGRATQLGDDAVAGYAADALAQEVYDWLCMHAGGSGKKSKQDTARRGKKDKQSREAAKDEKRAKEKKARQAEDKKAKAKKPKDMKSKGKKSKGKKSKGKKNKEKKAESLPVGQDDEKGDGLS
jgi:hypothetical protein